ncbi:MAG: serine hydrolase [Alphaproteobacteria bacterium]|nr:serine hydrolase [Alphaproteobacteria bacterium]
MVPVLASLALAAPTTPTADIRAPLAELVAPALAEDRIGALVVAVVAGGEVRTLAFGAEGLDKSTSFEVGSVSKAFTGLLLAEAVRRGEVRLDDPLSKYVEGDLPTWEGAGITLLDLATHTSGLPRLAPDFAPADPSDPYRGVGWSQVHQSLLASKLAAKPGETYAYSNLGAAVLGHALEVASGQPFEALLAERITTPLGMESTTVDASPVIQGHDADRQPVPPWSLGAYAPAGGIHSTARDLTRFVAAHLRPDGELGESVALATRKHRSLGPQGSVGLFWHRTDTGTVWHNGQTGGFHSLVAFVPAQGIAVVALGDTATDLVDRIGFAALELAAGETPAPLPIRKTVSVPDAKLDALAGSYGPAKVTHADGGLWLQLPDQPRVRLWPESETVWFLRVAPAQLTFDGNHAIFEQQGVPRQEWRRRR